MEEQEVMEEEEGFAQLDLFLCLTHWSAQKQVACPDIFQKKH
jgi:hypothetical protein